MTTTPAPKGADIEQYRPGFEAWARKKGFDIDGYDWDEYRSRPTQIRWEAWFAAKRESVSGSSTSTSQGAQLSGISGDLSKCPSCGGEADNGHDREVPPNAYYCKKCNSSNYSSSSQPSGNPGELGNSGAAPGDALDAARYRWLRDRPENPDNAGIDVAMWENCQGEALRGTTLDRAIDAAIAANTAQEKGE